MNLSFKLPWQIRFTSMPCRTGLNNGPVHRRVQTSEVNRYN